MATILVVDDLSSNRDFLATLLRHHGHRLVEAADGGAALAAVHSETPDLLITDVLMPVMNGYELVRQLRLEPRTRKLPVVFYTAHYGEREARALALVSGASYVLTKPTQSDDVVKLVNRALSGARERRLRAGSPPPSEAFDGEHLRLLTDKLSENAGDLRSANARLRALINIGLELASERDSDRLRQNVCMAARDLFGATYVTLGIIGLNNHAVQRYFTSGVETASWIKTGDAVSGILATVVAERRTLRGENPGGDPSRLKLPPLHPGIQNFLVAPITSPAHVYGWLCLVANEGKRFTEDDEHLVRALSGQIGRIHENGHFYAVARKRAAELDHEILERNQVESALRHARDRAQRYLDTADVLLLALDLDGRITLINRKGCDLLGWTERELIGRDWIETCLPVRIREVNRQRFQHLVGGDLPLAEDLVLTQSGEERLIEWRNTLLRDDAGHVIGTFSSGADITERHRAVEALRTAEERTRFALQSAKVGIWDHDYTSGVVRWSETLEAHHGLEPGTFSGTFEAFVELIHPDDRDMVRARFGSMKSGTDYSLEYRTLQADGSVRWLNGTGRIHLDPHGAPLKAVGIVLDVTERHTLEEQYQQAQKMEAIGRLAGGVAHDFNNLLTAILGYCELLLADLAPDDARHSDIIEIQKAGQSAAGLTRQLLAFSRKQIIEPTLLDLNVIVTDMRAMLGRLIGEDVKILLGLRTDLAPIKADRGQVEQILLNLAVNARDSMPGGGTLTIETANVTLDENSPRANLSVKPGPFVALTVTDTGTGMSPQVQARLFEPFFTTKAIGKGTGLGLATVHGIVARNGGSVNVCSEAGVGTSFKVYFPAADEAAMASETPPPLGRPRAGGQTVLVVEDEDGLRDLARRLLQRQGYRVLLAANADEALRLFERNMTIDVLLTDVVMPGASGPELTKRLLEQQPGLKVIYMSGYTEESIVHHGVINPAIAFLHKPFTSETLARKLREVLERDVLA
jgi:PAS domain S-box-containing protein